MKKRLGALLIAVTILSTSCIFGPSTRKVMSYRNQHVYLTNRQTYDVGQLPPAWERMRVKAYSIAFHDESLGSTIATDAFCGPAYEDSPLATLTSQMMAGVENYEIVSSREFMLDERGALRTVVTGRTDGVDLTYDIVVIKKNKCIFDFMLISPMGNYSTARADYEGFYSGFHYE
jgi:hypothetical protein